MTSLRVCAVIAAWWVTCAFGTAAAQAEAPAPASTNRNGLLAVHVDAVPLGGPVALAPELARPRPHVPVRFGQLVIYAFVGEIVGAGIGAVVAAVAGVASCHGNEGWVSGFTCGAGIGYAASMGALIGAAIGAPISVAAGGARRHAGGDGWAGLGGSMLGLGAGVGLFGILEAVTDQPTLATGLGGLLSVVLGLLLPPAFYDLGRPRPGAPTVAVRGLGLEMRW